MATSAVGGHVNPREQLLTDLIVLYELAQNSGRYLLLVEQALLGLDSHARTTIPFETQDD